MTFVNLQFGDDIFEDEEQFSTANPLLVSQLQQERFLAEKAASYPKMENARTNFLCFEFRARRKGCA